MYKVVVSNSVPAVLLQWDLPMKIKISLNGCEIRKTLA